ncbi:hypothetical protein CDAR_101581 [Caerostris darwini]|uniref:Uncharacterized protein n=1 Tax=Caerostris darwini TaxID=1538125 RepID=A0AAV4SSX8_9ARAC|nr:hypothetical protein CDAR_101581 [Caerostris darwini]
MVCTRVTKVVMIGLSRSPTAPLLGWKRRKAIKKEEMNHGLQRGAMPWAPYYCAWVGTPTVITLVGENIEIPLIWMMVCVELHLVQNILSYHLCTMMGAGAFREETSSTNSRKLKKSDMGMVYVY